MEHNPPFDLTEKLQGLYVPKKVNTFFNLLHWFLNLSYSDKPQKQSRYRFLVLLVPISTKYEFDEHQSFPVTYICSSTKQPSTKHRI